MKLSSFSMVMVVCVLLASALIGCGSDGGSNDFSADCSICFNDSPAGPSADAASCTAWGTAFGCGTSTLANAGMCGDPAATCQVSECTSNPVGCTLAE